MLYSERHFLEIFGAVDGTGALIQIPVASLSRVASSPVGVLASVGAAGGVTVTAAYTPALYPLQDRRILWASGWPQPPQLSRVMRAADTTIYIVDDGPTLSGLHWIGGEWVSLTHVATSAGEQSYTAVRAQRGTPARAHVWRQRDRAQAPRLLTHQPTAQGARCVLYRDTPAGRVDYYRGVVESVTVRGAEIQIAVGSAMAVLRGQGAELWEYAPDASRGGLLVQAGRVYGSADYIDDEVDFTGTPAWTTGPYLVRVWWGQAWVVCVGQLGAVIGDDGAFVNAVLQWGIGPAAYPLGGAPPNGIPADERRVPDRIQRLPVVRSQSSPGVPLPVSGVLIPMLTMQWPPGGGGLVGADLDLVRLNRTTADTPAPPESIPRAPGVLGGDDLFWPLPARGNELASWYGAGVAGPHGMALVAGVDGAITVLDWLDALAGVTPRTTADLRAEATDIAETATIRRVRIEVPGLVRQYRSILGDIVGTATSDVSHGMPWLSEADDATWITLTDVWSRPCVVVEVVLSRAAALAPGDTCRLSCPTIVGPDGARGVTDAPALCLSTSYDPLSPMAQCTLALAAYGAVMTLAVWGVSARVTAPSTGTAVAVAYFGGLTFLPGQSVEVCSPSGVAAATRTVGSIGAGTVTFTAAVTVTTGDILLLSAGSIPTPQLEFNSGQTYA
jgi:hypothetical protein